MNKPPSPALLVFLQCVKIQEHENAIVNIEACM